MMHLSLHEIYAMSPMEQIQLEIVLKNPSPSFFLNENQYLFLQTTGIDSMERQKEILLSIRRNESLTEIQKRTIHVCAETWTHIYGRQEKLRSLHHVYFIQEQEFLLQQIARPTEDIDAYARTSRLNFTVRLGDLRTIPNIPLTDAFIEELRAEKRTISSKYRA